MMGPAKFMFWILGAVFTLGLADSFASLTYKMGEAAISAHKNDRVSYSSYTHLLWKNSLQKTKKKIPSSK